MAEVKEKSTLKVKLLMQSVVMLAYCLIKICVLLNLSTRLSVERSEGKEVTM